MEDSLEIVIYGTSETRRILSTSGRFDTRDEVECVNFHEWINKS